MILRGAKIFLAGGVGLLALLIGLDNIFDYETNFAAVRHILSMDTIPPGSPLVWRAIHNGAAHHLAYAFIIATEVCAGALCLVGASQLARARKEEGRAFNEAKGVAILGLVAALSLYFVGFTITGGEWFQMWRSDGWNMQEPAFRFVGAVGVVLLFLAQGDEDLPDGE
jgi:predicted small integral membrane protein